MRSFFILFICVISITSIIAQDVDTILQVKNNDVKFNKRTKINAIYLVDELTKDKETDKDKFDAIFYWVAKNINYNSNYFYSASKAGPHQIEQILKTRSTICLGYAQLMDTLCKLAGIPNVTVFGYAKDELYDINDSIYGHNHAWNAVKLNNEWYLYDVTWSEGETEYLYTKKAKFILKLLKRFPEKYKTKTIKEPRKFKRYNFCNEKYEPFVYPKQRFFNSLIRKLLLRVPIKVFQKHFKGINTKFYLADPVLFSTTHIPDDPTWSLLKNKNIRSFEEDSLFYYLHDSMYKTQNRTGTKCLECDKFYEANSQERLNLLNTSSLNFNKRNQFLPTFCNEELGKIMYYKSYHSDDLPQKDSSVNYFNTALNHLVKGKGLIERFYKFQKTKNDAKMKLLLVDNKKHTLFFKSKVKVTISHKLKFQEMINKVGGFWNVYSNKYHAIKRFNTKINIQNLKPYPEKKLNDLLIKETALSGKLDSLKKDISGLVNTFDSCLINLSLNVKPLLLKHDSILVPFVKCIELRRFYKDNYKKLIVDVRKQIPVRENDYINNIDFILYKPATLTEQLFQRITKNIKIKQFVLSDLLKVKKELAKAQNISEDELTRFKSEVVDELKRDLCWLRPTNKRLLIAKYGFERLNFKQNNALSIISYENQIERYRHSSILHALKRGHAYSVRELGFNIAELRGKLKDVTTVRNLLRKKKIPGQRLLDRIDIRFSRDYDKITF